MAKMYPKVMYLKGLDQVLRNINLANKKIEHAAERGLIEAGKYLREESRKIVPVQTGKLKASAFLPRNVGGKGLKADIIVGYSGCDYGIFVHEDLVAQAPPARAAHGKFFNIKHAAEIATAKGTPAGTAAGGMFNRKPEEQAKFLEQPMKDNRKTILRIIANSLRKIK